MESFVQLQNHEIIKTFFDPYIYSFAGDRSPTSDKNEIEMLATFFVDVNCITSSF